MRFTKPILYGAFCEIDEMSDQYGDQSIPVLEEMEIDHKSIIGAAAVNAVTLAQSMKSYLSGGPKTTASYLFDKRTAVGDFPVIDKQLLSILATIWIDAFVCRLIIEERSGKTWERIDKATIDNILTAKNNPEYLESISVRDSLYSVEFLDMAVVRSTHILYDSRKKNRPTNATITMLSRQDKVIVRTGQAIFLDGFIVAGLVPFRD